MQLEAFESQLSALKSRCGTPQAIESKMQLRRDVRSNTVWNLCVFNLWCQVTESKQGVIVIREAWRTKITKSEQKSFNEMIKVVMSMI